MQRKSILVIECHVNDLESARPTLEKDVEQYLREEYIILKIGQLVRLPKNLADIQSVHVVDLITAQSDPAGQEPELADQSLEIHLFHLYNQPRTELKVANPSTTGDTDPYDADGTEGLRAHVTLVPHVELQGLWESLLFNEPLHTSLLRFLLRMIAFARTMTSSFNRIVLLYGPSGTGKTTLCCGLVQKLAIRLRQEYKATKLIELDAAALFSKYFGESSKLVNEVFDSIESLLAQEPDVFICIFVDEIESLAGTRERSKNANEPKDSMRAVNALLVALDRLSKYSNVVVLCTSNLMGSMDPAVLDRIDVKQYVPLPSVRINYEIFRRCYLDLLARKVIIPLEPDSGETLMDGECIPLSHDDFASQPSEAIPGWEAMQASMALSRQPKEISIPYRLCKLAEKSIGLSGRVIHRLPMQAIAMHTKFDPCSCEEALDALSQFMNEQQIDLNE
ncbi:MAG: hypothetical protein L6R36_005863 [Xanthoria steineri]|nr:MAG: hypothetical protein L6R36_005863 [Xanthoria steineri]